jgi:hypothetical protein
MSESLARSAQFQIVRHLARLGMDLDETLDTVR